MFIDRNSSGKAILRKLLVEAVEKRLMGNRQFGFMLSGGLDSSLVAGRDFCPILLAS